MKKTNAKKILCLVLTVVLALAIFTGCSQPQTPAKQTTNVYFTIEAPTLTDELIVKPTKVEVHDGDNLFNLLLDVIKENNLGVLYAGDYIKAIVDGNTELVVEGSTFVKNENEEKGLINILNNPVISDEIYNAIYKSMQVQTGGWGEGEEPIFASIPKEDLTVAGNTLYGPGRTTIDGITYATGIGAGSFSAPALYSGWMFYINNADFVFPTTISTSEIKNNDVIRMEFSLAGMGEDLGFGFNKEVKSVDKSELIIKLADIIDLNEESKYATFDEAMAVLGNVLATKEDVAQAIKGLVK